MQIIDLGFTHFLDAYKIQCEFVQRLSQGLCEDTLLITEHQPVITIGRRGLRSNVLRTEEFLASRSIKVLNIDRGGDVTYHGPGQIVAYPIFRLENEARDIHNFLDYLEEVARRFLKTYGIEAEKRPGFRGVWLGGKKVGSIGIGVKKWVTYHGLAININIDLEPFSFIKPCGMDKVEIASLEKLLGSKSNIEDAKDRLAGSFREIPLLAEAIA